MKFLQLLVLISYLLTSIQTRAQISSNKVKATLILHFCENITWQKPIDSSFVIGCYTDDNSISSILKSANKTIRIQDKNFEVRQLKSIEEIFLCNAVYYNKTNSRNFQKILTYARDSNILLITDNIENELFVMINLKEKNNKISYNINIPNISLAGFQVKPNLLLSSGSIVDIKKAYEKFEKQVNENKQNLDKIRLDLANNEKLLIEKDALLQQKEKELGDFTNKIDLHKKESKKLNTLILNEKKLLSRKNKENEKNKVELQRIHTSIKQKQDDLNKLNRNIKLLKNESNTLKNVIVSKNSTLNQQQQHIYNQKKMIYLSIALLAALILAAITLMYLFIIKKRHNRELEVKVDIRTKELQNKTNQYLSLFNLAPVAILEIDLSEVKKYINSKTLTNEKEYDEYVKNNPDFITECFERNKFIQINNAALELYGIEKIDELYEMYDKNDKQSNYERLPIIYKLIFLNKQNISYEGVRTSKDNTELNVLINWIEVSEQKFTYSRVLLTMVDVTQLRKTELELIKHQKNLETLVARRTDELETTVEELNSTNEELFDKNQIINEQMSELKNTMEHLKETQSQLIQAEKMASLGVLTAGVAHEINNPLNYIMGGYVGLKKFFKGMGNQKNEKVLFLLETIKLGIDRASGIVKGLNQFSRDNDIYDEDCEIHSIIDNCLAMLQNQLKNRIDINKNYDNNPLNIKGNVGKLHQVFINILTNASQAISAEGSISIETQMSNSKAIIEIADSGYGMSEEVISKITDPFFTTKDPGEGTGLGLSLTYKIILAHKGELDFKSEINKGTTVKIILPIN